MTTAIIDGDTVLYPICAAFERETDWGEIHTLHSEWESVKDAYWAEVDRIGESVKAQTVVIAFSDKANFRKELWPGYKANRVKRKPLCYSRAVQETMEVGMGVIYPRLEADDVLGILGTGTYQWGAVMVSTDKDLKTVPGLHWNPMKPELGIVEITPEEAHINHMLQTLTGDPTDGFQGCPGVGPVSAQKVLEAPWSPSGGLTLWEHVVNRYSQSGLTEEDALLQARLAFILQFDYWDDQTKEVKLWNPN